MAKAFLALIAFRRTRMVLLIAPVGPILYKWKCRVAWGLRDYWKLGEGLLLWFPVRSFLDFLIYLFAVISYYMYIPFTLYLDIRSKLGAGPSKGLEPRLHNMSQVSRSFQRSIRKTIRLAEYMEFYLSTSGNGE